MREEERREENYERRGEKRTIKEDKKMVWGSGED